MNTSGTISAPQKPTTVPENAQWLGGQGTGGWFYLETFPDSKTLYRIIRYSPKGVCECDRTFTLVSKTDFDATKDFEFTYISHCAACNIMQNGVKHRFVFKA